MTYTQAIDFLNTFIDYEKRSVYNYAKAYNLERVKTLLKILGNPQDNFNTVVVSGTKGKGSCCVILYSILTASGYKAGLYTSPHLLDLRERIRVSGKLITKTEFARFIDIIRNALSRHKSLTSSVTYFEVLTACAFLYFTYKKVDIAVLEVGLGGRLDATNATTPLCCGILPISYDHTQILGKSLKRIAGEKAGIIKKGIPVVSAPQKKEALEVLKGAAKRKRSKLYLLRQDIKYTLKKANLKGEYFDYQGIYENYKNLKIPLLGNHQIINAAVAIGIAEILKKSQDRIEGKRLTATNIRKGLKKACWPGRFEIIKKGPYVILDGAQNKASAQALKEAFFELMPGKVLASLVLGLSSDKDIEGVGSVLCPIAENVIFTRASSPRAASPEYLARRLKSFCKRTFIAKDTASAMKLAGQLSDKDKVILVTGSLYLVGEALQNERYNNSHIHACW